MVPAALTRSVPPSREGVGLARNQGWQPPNLPAAARAERRAAVVWGALLGGLGVILLLGHVWVRLQVIEAAYQLSAMRQLVERLETEGRELRVQAAAADAPQKIAVLARSRLGMRPPVRGEEVSLP